jgi:hypothetical protein
VLNLSLVGDLAYGVTVSLTRQLSMVAQPQVLDGEPVVSLDLNCSDASSVYALV